MSLEKDPNALFLRDPSYSDIDIVVCEDCGFVHSFAADLLKLLKARAERDGEPVKKKEVKIQWKK